MAARRVVGFLYACALAISVLGLSSNLTFSMVTKPVVPTGFLPAVILGVLSVACLPYEVSYWGFFGAGNTRAYYTLQPINFVIFIKFDQMFGL